MPSHTPVQKALRLLKKQGTAFRFSEAIGLGIHRRTLTQMLGDGLLERLSRGLYRLTSADFPEQPDLVTVSRRVPGALVCLVSALALHDLTTQIPHAVAIALRKGRTRPRIEHPAIEVHWWSSDALTLGVERRNFGGVEILLTNPERSVADAFRYRKQLGVDLAIEALRSWRERKGARPDALLAAARVVRVERVITPYLETIL